MVAQGLIFELPAPCIPLSELVGEAHSQFEERQRLVTERVDGDRGDSLRTRRRLSFAHGSHRLIELHNGEGRAIAEKVLPAKPFPTRCSFVYYEPGDFLGPHQDMDHCEITLIVPLTTPSRLVVFPDGVQGTPAEVSAAFEDDSLAGGVDVDYRQGAVYAIYGQQLIHARKPTTDGLEMSAVLCYATLTRQVARP